MTGPYNKLKNPPPPVKQDVQPEEELGYCIKPLFLGTNFRPSTFGKHPNPSKYQIQLLVTLENCQFDAGD